MRASRTFPPYATVGPAPETAASTDETGAAYNSRVVFRFNPNLQLYDRLLETTRSVAAGEMFTFPIAEQKTEDRTVYFYNIGERLVGHFSSDMDAILLREIPESLCEWVAYCKLSPTRLFVIQGAANASALRESLHNNLKLEEFSPELFRNEDGLLIYLVHKSEFLIYPQGHIVFMHHNL